MLYLIIPIALAFVSVSCTPTKFASEKKDFLKASNVFENGDEPIPPDDANGVVPQPNAPAAPTDALGTIPVEFYCSTARSETTGNLTTAKSLVLKLQNLMTGAGACQFSNLSIRDEILSQHGIRLSYLKANCPNSEIPKMGLIEITTTDALASLINSIGSISYSIESNGQIKTVGLNRVTVDYNPDNLPADVIMKIDPKLCDDKASPLVMQLAPPERARPVDLTSQAEGIWFDILGRFSAPTPHTPKRISWFRNNDYALIALPNAQGEVRGIDELFGDNTAGPDGLGAENGYKALAKHDSDGDGFITTRDEVFNQLRLWVDFDKNGRSRPRELYPLSAAGVEAIDLTYDESYLERDRHGNETRMKSVIRLGNGQLRLIFDLWFKY